MNSNRMGQNTHGNGTDHVVGRAQHRARRRARLRRLTTWAFFLLVAGACSIWFAYRPWALHWGATRDEIHGAMTGDEIVADATFIATRGVTIDAPPEEIWPWLIQMGYLKAGFYSYDRLDNDGVPSTKRIIPEYQQLAVGDSIPLSDDVYADVAAMIPNRTMLWVIQTQGPWTWAWTLTPLNSRQTRLVSRLRVRPGRTMTRVMLDLGEIIMMRRCLLGIKRRAESLARGSRPPATDPRGSSPQ